MFALFGILGLVPLIGCLVIGLALVILFPSPHWNLLATRQNLLFGVVLSVATIGGLGFVVFGLLLRSSGRALKPGKVSTLSICKRSLWNGKWVNVAEASTEDCFIGIHPVVIGSRIVPDWRGVGCVVHVGKERFAIAIVRNREAADHVLKCLPPWLSAVPQRDGEEIRAWGDIQLGVGSDEAKGGKEALL